MANDNPTRQETRRPDGSLQSVTYGIGDEETATLHRADGPALLHFFENETILYWFLNGIFICQFSTQYGCIVMPPEEGNVFWLPSETARMEHSRHGYTLFSYINSGDLRGGPYVPDDVNNLSDLFERLGQAIDNDVLNNLPSGVTIDSFPEIVTKHLQNPGQSPDMPNPPLSWGRGLSVSSELPQKPDFTDPPE